MSPASVALLLLIAKNVVTTSLSEAGSKNIVCEFGSFIRVKSAVFSLTSPSDMKNLLKALASSGPCNSIPSFVILLTFSVAVPIATLNAFQTFPVHPSVMLNRLI